MFLTIDNSLSLPQRVRNAVDIVVDVVAGPRQFVHLRFQLVDGLRQKYECPSYFSEHSYEDIFGFMCN